VYRSLPLVKVTCAIGVRFLTVDGRGVIDCLTGEKIARDDEEFYEGEIYGSSFHGKDLIIAA
jgi:hypothetical protein